ncbi:MAG: 1-deoxy-D-xylulose-5-phosphate synthase [Nitrospirae bacterium]|nr:1-deoxy-D-xylulose-5-phosphate synthase [Nitrospirota bacterium]
MALEKISSPEDLRTLSHEELKTVAQELRTLIIETVAVNGGHLASNLGIIELTLALHHAFNSPVDKIVWDVGHQSYAHKILTGRKEQFSTLRTEKGLSGFPKISESPHDAFGTGHSSTSISAALGLLEARDRNHEHFKVIAVIGDGALSGGIAFEGLNNAGHGKKDLIVILNDNEMSISPNVGALSAYMNRILTDERYRKFKKETISFLEGIPKLGGSVAKIAKKTEETLKGMILPGILFEELGFDYIGPIDGHNTELLIETFNRIKSSTSPTLVHVITKKGKGYEFSEKDPCVFHGIGPFEVETGSPLSTGSVTYSAAFGASLAELAETDARVIAISAAMKEGTGLDCFAERFPDRFYDVGIAEQHAVTFAAGLAAGGLRPVVAVYSTFLQRAYDQIIHDVCLQNLPVVFAIDRAGLVGEDGPTHHGIFDISFLRHIPNLTCLAPKNTEELRLMFAWAVDHAGPVAIRYPRGRAPQSGIPAAPIALGCAEPLHDGNDMVIMAIGNPAIDALKAAERLEAAGIHAAVINARFIKPLDRDMLLSMASRIPRIITVEENALQGGFGSAVMECLNEAKMTHVAVKRLGIPDLFIEQGSMNSLRAACGIDEEGIYQAALAFMKEPLRSS